MAHHAGARVVEQHALQAPGHGLGAVGHDDHAGVLRIAHADTAAMVQADPGGAAGRVEQRVQQRPVGHGVAAVLHRLGLAVGAGDRAAVEVVAADDDGRLQLAALHHLVEGQAGAVALPQPQPADARRQALEGDALARHVQPAVHPRFMREQLLDLGIGLVDVLGVAGQGHPAEGAAALAELRPYIGRHEAREVEGVVHALVQCHLADVVAVVHRGHAHGLEVQHGLYMHRAAAGRRGLQFVVTGRIGGGGLPLLDAPAGRQIAIDEVVGRGLVGHHMGPRGAAALHAHHQLGQHLGGIAEQRDRDGPALGRIALQPGDGVIEVGGLLVHVAGLEPEVDARLLALDVQRREAGEGGRQRLGAAHATQAGRQHPLAAGVAAVVLAGGFGEGLVSALHDALGADVDPAPGRHLAVHHQALAVELVEVLPGGPVGHEVGIGEQHPRRVGMGAEHAHRLAGLHQQRLVIAQRAQRGQDAVVGLPVARGLADAAVDHQRVRVLGHGGVEVVLDHAVGGLGQPALAVQLGAGGCPNGTGRGAGQGGHADLLKLARTLVVYTSQVN
mmetsp:Transcript_6403/g.26196  ORF Transcript_6403/g.26196 Transcript_6403/m.26196 type:complete len:559 (+) Transcript_6403:860-2536(+)